MANDNHDGSGAGFGRRWQERMARLWATLCAALCTDTPGGAALDLDALALLQAMRRLRYGG